MHAECRKFGTYVNFTADCRSRGWPLANGTFACPHLRIIRELVGFAGASGRPEDRALSF